VALKLQPPKSQKLVIFDIYLPQRGISLLAIFTKFGMAERLSRTHKHANFRFYGFNINLPLRKNLGCPMSIEKFEYRCTTRNLPLCNGTIIVLKISLLHIVSVITNFVIPKRDKKQTDRQKNHTFLSTAGARLRIPTILGMVIEDVRAFFALPNFL